MYILSLGIRLYMDMDMDMRKHLLHLRSLGGRGALRHAHACVAETQRLRRSSIKNQGRKDATPWKIPPTDSDRRGDGFREKW